MASKCTEQTGEQGTPAENLATGLDAEAQTGMLSRSQELEALVHIADILVQPRSFKDKCTDVM